LFDLGVYLTVVGATLLTVAALGSVSQRPAQGVSAKGEQAC
jgi:hypothetical protein